MENTKHLPRLVVLELTRRCNLACVHCRASSRRDGYDNELKTKEWFRLLDDIASFSAPIIILSGGEALLREDVFDIIRYAKGLGLKVVLASCGTAITQKIAQELKLSGVKRLSISIDGKDSTTHDLIRGQKGVFDKALLAMDILRSAGLEFQINTTVTRRNAGQLKEIIELTKECGAVSFHPFFLVPVGRAKHLKDEEISPSQYEEILLWLYKESQVSPISIKPTCAPHYRRIASKDNTKLPGERADVVAGGCLGGKSFAFISSTGKVQICGFLEIECGNINTNSFANVWRESDIFLRLRNPSEYKGKCRVCEYLLTCGGCRARAYASTGDYLKEEPDCIYQPLTARS